MKKLRHKLWYNWRQILVLQFYSCSVKLNYAVWTSAANLKLLFGILLNHNIRKNHNEILSQIIHLVYLVLVCFDFLF